MVLGYPPLANMVGIGIVINIDLQKAGDSKYEYKDSLHTKQKGN